MPRFSNMKQLEFWWDENSTWAERTAFLLINLELLYVHGKLGEAKAVAELKFDQLPPKVRQAMLEY